MRTPILFNTELKQAYKMYRGGKSLKFIAAYFETTVAYLEQNIERGK